MREALIQADMLMRLRRFVDAEAVLRKALSTDPNQAPLHAALAVSLASQHKAKEALGEASAAIQLEPNLAISHLALGLALKEDGALERAVIAVKEAIRIDPGNAMFLGTLASIHCSRESWKEALVEVERGLAIDPEHADLLTIRAAVLSQLGRYWEAQDTLKKALRQNPENARARLLLGAGHLQDANYVQAAEEFQETLRLAPELDGARKAMIECYKARDPFYRFLLSLRAWLSSAPRALGYLVTFGIIAAYHFFRLMAKEAPDVWPGVATFASVGVLFVYFCAAVALASDAFLGLTRSGRLALDEDQIRAARVLTVSILITMIGIGTSVILQSKELTLFSCNLWLLVLPVSGIFRCRRGWPRTAMSVYAAWLAVFVLVTACYVRAESPGSTGDGSSFTLLIDPAMPPVVLFPLAFLVAATGEAVIRSADTQATSSSMLRNDRWIVLFACAFGAMLLAGYATYAAVTPPDNHPVRSEKDLEREYRDKVREQIEKLREPNWQLLQEMWRERSTSKPGPDGPRGTTTAPARRSKRDGGLR